MSLWDRLKNTFSRDDLEEAAQADRAAREEEAARPPPVPPAPVSAHPLDALARFGLPGGPPEDEARRALIAARGSADESRALAALLAASERLPESLLVACAEILALRGEEERALGYLARCSGPAALMLAADLHALRGEVARALGAVERVLARDLAAPGAIERHARWSEALGAGPRVVRRVDEATMVAPTPDDTPYRILREVARGGAGAVYEAFDELLERQLAFKAYHRGPEDRGAVEREVRLAARFAGPGVVRVLDASPRAGWVALEWAPRGSLREWIRAGRAEDLLPITRWAMPLARALARIHRAGFVHGDVKPANVLLHRADTPVLSDFGMARPIGDVSGGGSAGYVSPERLAGGRSSASDDVYGFGRAVEDVLGVSAAGQTPQLSAFVARCLAPEGHRPPDAAALVDLLAALGHP